MDSYINKTQQQTQIRIQEHDIDQQEMSRQK